MNRTGLLRYTQRSKTSPSTKRGNMSCIMVSGGGGGGLGIGFT